MCCTCAPRHLPSFPTRRSSDLRGENGGEACGAVVKLRMSPDLVAEHDGGLVRTRSRGAAGQLRQHQPPGLRSEEHTSELQSPMYLVCRLLLEKKKHTKQRKYTI